METAVAQPARIVPTEDEVPYALRDVQDLHDADLDAVVNDWLADGDADGATAAAAILARLVGRSGSAAPAAHDLGVRAERLLHG